MVLKQYLEQNFPELKGHVYGANYPPPAFAVALTQVVQIIQLAAVILLFLGERICRDYLGYTTTPAFIQVMKNNQIQTFIGLFLLSSISQGFLATGAFEVEINGQEIFSKLKTGALPNLKVISRAIMSKGVKTISNSKGIGGL